MNPTVDDMLMHYGKKYRSGRYPYGSGKESYQHSGDFLSRVETLQKEGHSLSKISEIMEISTTDLRMQMRVAKHERRNLEIAKIESLKADGLNISEIARQLGYKNESSVRALLNKDVNARKNMAASTADILVKELGDKKMLDIGAGTEHVLGVNADTLKEAAFILETKGYHTYPVGVPIVNNPTKRTITSVLCAPGTEHSYAYQHLDEIKPVGEHHSVDGGLSYLERKYPASIGSDRVAIRYREDGGVDKDGVIEIRRGVADLNLGNSHYAQVRILVDGDHYLKGMAMYSDDIPAGHDIMFNTNKSKDVAKADVMKSIETDDPMNPFGAYIKANGQSEYTDPKTGETKLSAINKLKEEGDWDKMANVASSQFLSKQPIKLIKQQLSLTYADAEAQLDSIAKLTNPTVKRKMLMDFAGNCDGAVIHLKAAALPRQKIQVILPLKDIKDTEVYAPNYKNGERVALVRYPHGGTFEIPSLIVNNRNPNGTKVIGPDVKDAIGISAKVAEQLSGADFDGDYVSVIPINKRVKVQTEKPLTDLEGFDAKIEYAHVDGARVMKKTMVGKQMGSISNLITDMTLQGADEHEMARAIKHSMVVIDAKKHKLDYVRSEKDNGIDELKSRYQGYTTEDGKRVGGATTLISRRKQSVYVDERQGSAQVDRSTGVVSYKTSGRTYVDPKTGQIIKAQTKTKLLAETDNLHTLSSGTVQEEAYADYGNKMKSLANEARKMALSTGTLKYDSNANTIYKKEVASLTSKLNTAIMNAPRERYAQRVANSRIKAMKDENPELKTDKKRLKKLSDQYVRDVRNVVGAKGKETKITLTDKEWEAIQAGAIHDNMLAKILRYTDSKTIRERATPRTNTPLSTAETNKIKAMRASGYTNDQIAEALQRSVSTVLKYA